ncbi:hypothetical protein GBM01_12520 [Yersinia pseudotuberculosis]|nr:hypothetical protein [Yersinia pseudotuberculosis]MBO1562125.1 hypothetical protein [Yersinia pseudotuberculosis]
MKIQYYGPVCSVKQFDKRIEIGFGFKAFSQFSRKGFEFLLVHNLPVSVVGVNISKTGNYTILITVSRI